MIVFHETKTYYGKPLHRFHLIHTENPHIEMIRWLKTHVPLIKIKARVGDETIANSRVYLYQPIPNVKRRSKPYIELVEWRSAEYPFWMCDVNFYGARFEQLAMLTKLAWLT